MPIYEYLLVENSGKTTKKTLSAESLEDAKTKLRRQKVFIAKIYPVEKKQNKTKLALPVLVDFTRQLAQLLKSGLPLFESLLVFEEKMRSSKYHFLFLDLCDRVKQGSKLSATLAQYPSSFDAIYCSMIAAAEETGQLSETFQELALQIQREEKIRKKLISAMVYPAFLGSFCFVIVFAMFFFLIPSLKDLFEGKQLHPLTKFVVQLSDLLRSKGWVLGALFFMKVSLISSFFSSKKGQELKQKLFLRLPLLKGFITSSVLFRFTKSMAGLLKSGVSLVYALQLSKDVLHHIEFEKAIDQSLIGMIKGGKLSTELDAAPCIPKLMVRMVATAEKSAALDQMFGHLADIYQEELEKKVEQFLQLLQPLLILFLGLIVGFVVLSIMLPLTDVSSFLR